MKPLKEVLVLLALAIGLTLLAGAQLGVDIPFDVMAAAAWLAVLVALGVKT
jgi:hypothetical protein